MKIRILIFTTFAAVCVLFFQNAVIHTNSILNYYNTQVALCTATDHTGCSGQLTRISYVIPSGRWGVPLSPAVQVCSPNPNYTCALDPWYFAGFTRYGLRPAAISDTITYRSTGIYRNHLEGFDTYFNPTIHQEYSYAYASNLAKQVSKPMRQTNVAYYYNTNPIPNNADGLTYNIFDVPKSETLVGVGLKLSNVFNTKGEVVSVSKYGLKTDYEFDSKGQLAAVYSYKEGTKYLKTQYSNYKCGVAQTETNAVGEITKGINNDCLLGWTKDPMGNVTSTIYDSLGRVKSVTDARNVTRTISRPDENTEVTDEPTVVNGKSTILRKTVVSDALGRQLSTVTTDVNDNSVLLTKSTQYDYDSRPKFYSFPQFGSFSGQGESVKYDVLDRVISRIRTVDKAETTFQYQSPDQVVITKPSGYKAYYSLQAFGSPTDKQLIQARVNKNFSDADAQVTDIRHDLEGKVLEVSQDGVTRRLAYNTNQLLTQTQEPDRADTTLTYFAGTSLLKTKQTAGGNVTSYEYDEKDRLKNILFSDSSKNITYTYDKNDRVSSITTPANGVIRNFTYDQNGNKKMDKLTVDGITFQFNFTYNNLNKIDSITYPDITPFVGSGGRNQIIYDLNVYGGALSIRDKDSVILSKITYNPNGLFKDLVYGNGAKSTLTLNQFQWPASLSVISANNNIPISYSAYDLDGNLTKLDDASNGGAYSQQFSYDGLGRITTATFPKASDIIPPGAPNNLGGSIVYTNTGDITKYTEFAKATRNLTYDAKTQLLTRSTGPENRYYNYDEEGRTTSNSELNFEYDDRGNLVNVRNVRTGNLEAQYVYDTSDMRVKKVVSSGLTTYYFYINDKLHFEASNLGIKEYFYFGNSLIASRTVTPEKINYQYYHFNPTGSVIAVTKPDKSMIRESYNVFGSSMLDNENFKNATNIRLAGHVSDDETGLVYMLARYYDPKIGRFLQPDAVGFKEKNLHSFNRYAYVNNNPNLFTDPNGHFPFLIVGLLALDAAGFGYSAYEYFTADTTTQRIMAAAGMGLSAIGLGATAVAAKGTSLGFRSFIASNKAPETSYVVAHGSEKIGNFLSHSSFTLLNGAEGEAINNPAISAIVLGSQRVAGEFSSYSVIPGARYADRILAPASIQELEELNQMAMMSGVTFTTVPRLMRLSDFVASQGSKRFCFVSCNGDSFQALNKSYPW